MALPVIAVDVAFATDPGDTPAWTDVSAYAEGFTVHRGRSGELDRFGAGRATIVLGNEDRRFDPSYTSSPYYPNVVPMRRVRIRAVWDAVTYDVFNGYADGWEQTYEHPKVAHCTLSVTDAFKVLANIELPAGPYVVEVLADSPTHWWRLGDPDEAATLLDAIGTAHLAVIGAPTLGDEGLVSRDSDTAMSIVDAGVNTDGAAILGGVIAAKPLTIEAIIRVPPTASDGLILYQSDAAQLTGFSLFLTAAGMVQLGVGTTTQASQFVTSTVAIDDDLPHHVAGTWTSGGLATLYVDGVSVGTPVTRTGSYGTPHSFALGAIPDLVGGGSQDAFEGTIDEVAVYDTALSAARVAAHNEARATAWSGEKSGARIGRILDAAGWPAADRNIDTGMAVLQGADLGGNALAALQKVEETEQGRLFISADGKVRFISRDNLLKTPYNVSQATYGDAGAELEYEDLAYRYDDETIFNEAVVSRDGGVIQTAADATSQTRYLRRTKVLDGLLHASDLTSLDLANWIVAHYKDALLRVTDLTLHPAVNATTHFPEVLGTELAERVTVKRTPQCLGAAIDQATHVEGIDHQVNADDWISRWNLSPAEVSTYWILGVAGFSELGVTTRLGFRALNYKHVDGEVSNTVPGSGRAGTRLLGVARCTRQHRLRGDLEW